MSKGNTTWSLISSTLHKIGPNIYIVNDVNNLQHYTFLHHWKLNHHREVELKCENIIYHHAWWLIIYTCIYEIHHPNDITSNFNADIFSEISWDFVFFCLFFALLSERYQTITQGRKESIMYLSGMSVLLVSVTKDCVFDNLLKPDKYLSASFHFILGKKLSFINRILHFRKTYKYAPFVGNGYKLRHIYVEGELWENYFLLILAFLVYQLAIQYSCKSSILIANGMSIHKDANQCSLYVLSSDLWSGA